MHEELLRQVYGAFNARNVDAAVARMQPAVQWANGAEGGYVRGQAGVRQLWARQWQKADVRIEPLSFSAVDGGAVVEVLKTSRSLRTGVETEAKLRHVFKIRAGLVVSMSVRDMVALEPAG